MSDWVKEWLYFVSEESCERIRRSILPKFTPKELEEIKQIAKELETKLKRKQIK